MRRLLRFFLCFVALGLAAVDVRAFDEAGHFYTAYALAMTIRPDDVPKDQLLVSFCAQLPDMSADLDAVTVYSRAITSNPLAWLKWATRESTDSDAVRKMVTIQQLLHALTGGDSAAIEAVAKRNVVLLHEALKNSSAASRPAALCALGFGLHFLGDSVAHQRLDDSHQMYATGRGHAADLHYPDYVLCGALAPSPRLPNHCLFDGPRFLKWKAIWTNAGSTYDPDDVKIDPAPRQQLFDAVTALGPSAADSNDWNESAMRLALAGKTHVADYSEFILKQKSDRPCDAVLAEAIDGKLQLSSFKGLKCATIWSAYWPSINRAFTEAGGSIARADLGHRAFSDIYIANPIDP